MRTTSTRSCVDKMLGCFYDYRFPAEMQKAFDGADRFFPINYKTSWAVVRDGGQGLRPGASTRRLVRQGDAKREAAAAARRERRPPEARRRSTHARRSDSGCRSRTSPASRSCVDIDLDIARARHHRDHRAVGHGQVDADPLHQPARRPDRGRDPVRGRGPRQALAARRCAARGGSIGMVFQEYNLVERLTVMENLLSGRLGYVSAWRAWRRKFPPADIRSRLRAPRRRSASPGSRTQRADALSGGQRQRVGIARAVMQQPEAAARRRADLVARPQDLGRDHGAARRRRARRATSRCSINMHDVELAKRFADRIVGMSGGDGRLRRPARGADRRRC